jgi:hypothetical protein
MGGVCRVELGGTDPLVEKVPEDHHFIYRSVSDAILFEEKSEHPGPATVKPAVRVERSARRYATPVAHVDITEKDPFDRLPGIHGTPLFCHVPAFRILNFFAYSSLCLNGSLRMFSVWHICVIVAQTFCSINNPGGSHDIPPFALRRVMRRNRTSVLL